jgi:hypothetical protein
MQSVEELDGVIKGMVSVAIATNGKNLYIQSALFHTLQINVCFSCQIMVYTISTVFYPIKNVIMCINDDCIVMNFLVWLGKSIIQHNQ